MTGRYRRADRSGRTPHVTTSQGSRPQPHMDPRTVAEPPHTVGDVIVDAERELTGVPAPGDVERGRFHLSRQMWIRIAIAVVIVGLATVTNRSFLGWGLFAVLAVLFMPISRFRSFIIAFAPYGTVWAVFTFLRSFADETPLAEIVNLRVLHFERWLFDGQILTVTLQSRYYEPEHLHWWDFFFTFVHWSYFLIPHVLAFRLWQVYPHVFKRFLAAMTILLTLGLALYFLIPTNPPWLSDDSPTPAGPTVLRVMETVAHKLGGGIYQASYSIVGESNPIAAMPSIHTAITFLLIFPAAYFGRVWKYLAIAYALSMMLALVYLGEHYISDVTMGALVATLGWWLAGRWVRDYGPRVEAQLKARRTAHERALRDRTAAPPGLDPVPPPG
jgi:membrane-associated phospholipid phosphatase